MQNNITSGTTDIKNIQSDHDMTLGAQRNLDFTRNKMKKKLPENLTYK